ncbi:hypothetical protein DQ04_01201000 [Trypanosoma grayi]|uniref:hypothetical protein n=1 Tax=Trypanosoma grayi TaxID=71804 RepID=UPI0004F4B4BD|nr:hypothetical protein DQ04_01201000 [Trypanosoma grayi]KEG13114.1 hypothetical protein DQ04_01201000 [Trypanosoma grayi]
MGRRITRRTLGTEVLAQLQEGVVGGKLSGKGLAPHGEVEFIILHQIVELCFKVLIADLRQGQELLKKASSAGRGKHNPSAERNRFTTSVASREFFITPPGRSGSWRRYNPGKCLEFRDCLVSASSLQSVTFHLLEQLLGVLNVTRSLVNGASGF